MSNIRIFENKKIRTAWNADSEEWLFSIVDVIAVLTDSTQPRKYWSDLKTKLKAEGSELSDFIGQLKMPAEDGKMREIDVLDTKGLLRLIQSVPSKKAEPFKMWLAEVGNDRLNEIAKEGGDVAGIAKAEFEKRTGKRAVSAINAKNKNMLEIKGKR
ncbi:MAG: Bro-N domain-containing protein [Treponema sp.]|jgi:prophage antirepressor-like protein|nr:Bro-N domain-containing protein [Treponema sp.]